MQELNVRWQFADECPRIGSGQRGVNIKLGRKWVRFTEFATGHTCKLPLPVFEKLRHRIVSDMEPRKRFTAKGARRRRQ